MSHSLRRKSALLTGSLDGIGWTIARALAEQGCDIVLNGFGEADLIAEREKTLIRDCGVRARHHGADLRDTEQIADLVSFARAEHGSVDILVNNAVIRYHNKVEDFLSQDWDSALAVNLSAPFHLIRLTLPDMKRKGWGRIVNLASVLGLMAMPERVDYVTTKTGLIGMSRAVAVETLDYDITCNALCPGSVLTPNSDGRIRGIMEKEKVSREEATRTFLSGRQPAGRFVEQSSLAATVVFLCGPHSRDITGVALPIDAGWSSGA